MTPEVTALLASIASSEQRLVEIRSACPHQWAPSHPDMVDASTPVCVDCGDTQFGWYCARSPTKQCEYKGSEYCLHCRQPEERR